LRLASKAKCDKSQNYPKDLIIQYVHRFHDWGKGLNVMEERHLEATGVHDVPELCRCEEKPPSLWGRHTILSGVLTLLLLAVLAAFVNWQQFWREIEACRKGYLFMGAVFHYLTYPVRGLRWRHSLNPLPISGSRAKFGLIVFFYNFVDNLVPAKLGDLYASHMARINFGVRRSEALGSIVFLRMLDAWILLSAAFIASWVLFSSRLPDSVFWVLTGGSLIAFGASAIMVVFFWLDKSLPGWIPEKLKEMVHAFRKGMWPKRSEIIPIALQTLCIWVLETLWILFLVRAFGLKPSLFEVIFLTMIPLLASAFPLTPSGTGAVELTLFSCLSVVGVPTPMAVSLTVANRFIDYWLHLGLGFLIWVIRHRLGLRTWREVPLEDSACVTPPKPALENKALNEG
jgi:uncharacterized protein (TIRG00374 family)